MTGDLLAHGSCRDGAFLPRRRRRGFGGLLLLGALLAATAGGLLLHARLSGCPLWAVRRVEVEGNRSLGTVELLRRLRLEPGTWWWRVSPGALHRLCAEEPRLAAITVSWRWPRDLVVRVRERESFLRIWGDPPLEVARDGTLLETREDIDPADLPLLTGALPLSLAPQQHLDLVDAGDAWKEFLSLADDEPGFWREVSEIQYDGGRDFQVFLRQGRRVILWEAGINGDLKKTIPAILADLQRLGQEDAVLDLRFRDQVVLHLPAAAAAAADSAAAPPVSAVPPLGGDGVARRTAGSVVQRSGRRRA
jgi:cell division septal protein FtsQ